MCPPINMAIYVQDQTTIAMRIDVITLAQRMGSYFTPESDAFPFLFPNLSTESGASMCLDQGHETHPDLSTISLFAVSASCIQRIAWRATDFLLPLTCTI